MSRLAALVVVAFAVGGLQCNRNQSDQSPSAASVALRSKGITCVAPTLLDGAVFDLPAGQQGDRLSATLRVGSLRTVAYMCAPTVGETARAAICDAEAGGFGQPVIVEITLEPNNHLTALLSIDDPEDAMRYECVDAGLGDGGAFPDGGHLN
jgi:hypothetical protein